MKSWTIMTLAAAGLAATPALAQHGRTVAIDTPRYEGTRTTERNRAEGSLTRESDVTRKRDGATASSDFSRQRTEDGVTRDRTATDFQGRTASSHYERQRTAHGWQASGERVQRDGDVLTYRGRARVGEHRVVKREAVARNGQPIAARRVVRPRR
jgi:hypothetical protein